MAHRPIHEFEVTKDSPYDLLVYLRTLVLTKTLVFPDLTSITISDVDRNRIGNVFVNESEVLKPTISQVNSRK